MRIVFLGTSDYGEPSLRMMAKGCYQIAGVITQPDRKCGRGLKIAPCAIKRTALELGLPVFQPENINDADAVSLLKGLKPDLIVVIAYGQILSQKILNIPSIMTINIHGSLLPAYRGPAPVNWALMNGDAVTGNSLMKVVLKMDAGPVILARQHGIAKDDDALTLEQALSAEAAEVLRDGLTLISSGAFTLQEQDAAAVTYARKLGKEDGRIDWTMDADTIRNRIRGLAGWPGSFSSIRGKMLKIFPPIRVCGREQDARPGTVIEAADGGITVACGSGAIRFTEVQPEGKRRMAAGEFTSGHRIQSGDTLGG